MKRKLRILYLTQLFSKEYGGGEYIFHTWAEEMAKRGHIVHAIVQHTPREIACNEKVHVKVTSPIKRYGGTLPPTLKDNFAYICSATIEGIHTVSKHDLDLVHSNTYAPTIVGGLMKSLIKKYHVATIHDVINQQDRRYWRRWGQQVGVSWPIGFLGPLLEKVTLSMPADVIHTVSHTSENDLIDMGVKNRIAVIPNGLDLGLYRIDSTVEEKPWISFIGRLVFYKNLPILFAALKMLKRTEPSFKLMVIGDGPMRQEWQGMAVDMGLGEDVIFCGRVSHEKKLKIIQASRAIAQPSYLEGFGLTLLESYALKKPVLASKMPPLTELVQDGVDGYLVDPFNYQQWAQRLVDIMSDPSKAKLMGERGYEKVKRHYSIARVCDSLEELYGPAVS